VAACQLCCGVRRRLFDFYTLFISVYPTFEGTAPSRRDTAAGGVHFQVDRRFRKYWGHRKPVFLEDEADPIRAPKFCKSCGEFIVYDFRGVAHCPKCNLCFPEPGIAEPPDEKYLEIERRKFIRRCKNASV